MRQLIFYFKHNASKVICVESDKWDCALLRANASINGWNVESTWGTIRTGASLDFS